MRSRWLFRSALSLALLAWAVSCGGDDSSSHEPARDSGADASTGRGGRSGGLLPIDGTDSGSNPDSSVEPSPDGGSAGSGSMAGSGSTMDSGTMDSGTMDSGPSGCAVATFGSSAFGEACFGE